MLYAEKYKPITFKNLFHLDAVSSVRKWLRDLNDVKNNNYKEILYMYGPVASGKTTIIQIMLKNYHLIEINPDELRSYDKIKTLVTCNLSNLHYKQQSLLNKSKYNALIKDSNKQISKSTVKKNPIKKKESETDDKTSEKEKSSPKNIIFIDNIELCEKTIKYFIELCNQYINIPIIVISNNKINLNLKKSKEDEHTLSITSHSPNKTKRDKLSILEISINYPTDEELFCLIDTIQTKEKLGFTKLQINHIIEKSNHDIRQIFYILEQLKISTQNISHLLQHIDQKYTDIDLTDKLKFFFHTTQKETDLFILASSEPQLISNHIYQNFPTFLHTLHPKDLQRTNDILECISFSDRLNYSIFSHHCWDLYNVYTDISCVHSSYHIKECINKQQPKTPQKLQIYQNKLDSFEFKPYKDISYNYTSSYEELKNLIKHPLFRNIENVANIFHILCHSINQLNHYFDSKKKGKNTSKQEKIDLYKNMSDPVYIQHLNYITDLIYQYKLYIIPDKETLQTDDIDLKIIKRCINITQLKDDSKINKFIKPHTEAIMKLQLLDKINQNKVHIPKEKLIRHDIENLTIDFNDLFKLRVQK